MGFSVMLWGAKKVVPAEYWCPYGNSYSTVNYRYCKLIAHLMPIFCISIKKDKQEKNIDQNFQVICTQLWQYCGVQTTDRISGDEIQIWVSDDYSRCN